MGGDARRVDISVRSARHGGGTISLFPPPGANLEPDVFAALVSDAFEGIGAAMARPPFIANRASRLVHARGCNHLPAESEQVAFETLAAADNAGYRACNICFRTIPRVSGYDTEIRLGESVAGALRQHNPVVSDPVLSQRVTESGQRVLRSWPIPLRGYQYKFAVVEDDAPNAVACPAGRIYVTTGLLEAVESDAELDAVLAHEITHVERRHGYRQYRRAQTASIIGGIAGLLAGAAADKATKSPTTGNAVADLVRTIADMATTIALTGYGRNEESEADSYALAWAASNPNESPAAFMQMLSKLKYAESRTEAPERGASLLATHPQIDDRIAKAYGTTIQEFAGSPRFGGFDKEGNQLLTIQLEMQAFFDYSAPSGDGSSTPGSVPLEHKRELQVFASVETSSDLADRVKVRDIVLTSGGRKISLDNREDTEVHPVESIGMNFYSTKTGGLLTSAVDAIEVPFLDGVDHWERLSGD